MQWVEPTLESPTLIRLSDRQVIRHKILICVFIAAVDYIIQMSKQASSTNKNCSDPRGHPLSFPLLRFVYVHLCLSTTR